METVEELDRKLTKQREINKELVEENARLKAALGPVLDFKMMAGPLSAFFAVGRSQQIYRRMVDK